LLVLLVDGFGKIGKHGGIFFPNLADERISLLRRKSFVYRGTVAQTYGKAFSAGINMEFGSRANKIRIG